MDGGLKNVFHGGFKGGILLKGSLFRSFEPSACGPMLPGFMANQQEGINVIASIFPAVLMQDPASLGQTHGSKTVVLGDDKIALVHPADQCKVHTVCALVKNQGLDMILVELMGRITKNCTWDPVLLAQAYGDFRDGTSICVDQHSHAESPLLHIIP